ncbi:MAG: type I 3-dehydroquinate dehydratase [Bacteroidales bacterium]|jgi:3-dehydroquinate dehydratase type I|nr:type I 3-dehydroquinate dehydratase [Bacteroidales bacterium]
MDEKICVSLGGISAVECMRWAALLPLVELRLDMMQLSPENIELFALQCRQWVATCREGKYSERERTVQLSAAIRAGATYVDIEHESTDAYRKPLMELAKRLGTQVIISYHDFEKTPELSVLNGIIEQSQKKGADWVKLAVTANTAADAARIMSLYERHDRLIAFAMGDAGKITRIAAPFLGAPFTFASIDEARITAPGQLTEAQMKIIFQLLE